MMREGCVVDPHVCRHFDVLERLLDGLEKQKGKESSLRVHSS